MANFESIMAEQQSQPSSFMFLPRASNTMYSPLPSKSTYQLPTSNDGKESSDVSDPGSSSPQSPGSRSPHSPECPRDDAASGSRGLKSIRELEFKVDEASEEIYSSSGSIGRSRVSLALLLEASAAAAEADRKAEQRASEVAPPSHASNSETDKFVTEAIHRVQTSPRNQRNVELKPVDRRELDMSVIGPNWSRLGQIERDPGLLGECRRLVRGTQGCGRECDSKFTNLVEFAKHVDVMHDTNFRPFLCPKDRCPWAIIGFHERSECTRHIRTKHHKAMYSCGINGCNKIYNRSDAFRRHVRQAHANPESRFNRLSKRVPLLNDEEADHKLATDTDTGI